MALLDIIKYPDPRLKEVSEPVSVVNEEIKKLVSDMLETMHNAPGVGLAAVQVGVLKRIIVVDIHSRDYENRDPVIFINPEVVSSDGETSYEEGCLSVPGYTADIVRAERVKVRGLNINGDEVMLAAEGFLAIALQHEIDHLNGILFIDRMGLVKRDIFKRRFKKSRKDKAAAG